MNLYEFYSSNKKVNITENLIHAKDVESEVITENLRKWFKEKWVRFGPDGKIRGECARGSESEGKPKCLPRSKAHSLGKKGRASAASKKRREDPNPERRGAAINVSTKVKEDQEFKFSPEQEKWLGDADRTNPYIISRMPGPKPPPSYFNNSQNQQTAQNIQQSQNIANTWQKFRQSNSLSNKIINKIPGVNQVASAVDVGSKLVQGDLSGAGRQAIGMIPGAKNLNTALQVGDVARNLSSGNIKDAGMEALGIAAGQGNKDATNILKGVKNAQTIQKISQTLENKLSYNKNNIEETCPHCSGPMFNIDMLTEKKDACYYKVKSRYKVWPSAYASGALVKCRKRGASNWGKSKTNENLYFNVVGTDKKILINEFNMRRDVRGWYLTGDSASSEKLDAFRAFGSPLTEEELNQAGFSGSAATIGVDNPVSPVGSLSKSQRINKKSRSK